MKSWLSEDLPLTLLERVQHYVLSNQIKYLYSAFLQYKKCFFLLHSRSRKNSILVQLK